MTHAARRLGRAGDEEPLVDRLVDRGVWERVGCRNLGRWLVAWGVGQSGVGQDTSLGVLDVVLDQLLPGRVALGNDLLGVLLVLALAVESKDVFRLAVWNLVDSEPLVGGSQQAWQVLLDVLDVIQLGCQWVVDVDGDDLPVRLALVKQGHDTQDLDLLHLTWVGDVFTDLTHVQRIVVSGRVGLWVHLVWVLPGLWERTVVVDVPLVWEAVSHKSQLALLGVLDDWVQGLLLCDLQLCVGPSWHLHNHVQDLLRLICIQWDVVEWRDWLAVLLEVDLVVQGVECADLSGGVGHRCCVFSLVPIWSAVVIGVVTGAGCNLAVDLKSLLRIDDGLDCYSIHGVGACIGCVLTGIFAADYVNATAGSYISPIDGGWINHHYKQVGYQLAGMCAALAWTVTVTSILLLTMNAIPFLKLRLSADEEELGTDAAQIGEFTYEESTAYIPEPIRSKTSAQMPPPHENIDDKIVGNTDAEKNSTPSDASSTKNTDHIV